MNFETCSPLSHDRSGSGSGNSRDSRPANTKIRALVRQLEARGQTMLVYGPLVIYLRSRNVSIGTRTVAVTPRRWLILLVLASRAGKTVPIDRLTRMLGGDIPLSVNGVGQLVSHLRRKLEPAGIRISAVHGRGYRLERAT